MSDDQLGIKDNRYDKKDHETEMTKRHLFVKSIFAMACKIHTPAMSGLSGLNFSGPSTCVKHALYVVLQ